MSLELAGWLPPHAKVMFNEAEASAARILLQTFGTRLQNCDIVLFAGSESAEASLLNGYSKNPFMTAPAGAFWTLGASLGTRIWLGRVPSALNPSDGLSRRDRSWAAAQGWAEVRACHPDFSKWSFLVRGLPAVQHARRKLDQRRVRSQGQ